MVQKAWSVAVATAAGGDATPGHGHIVSRIPGTGRAYSLFESGPKGIRASTVDGDNGAVSSLCSSSGPTALSAVGLDERWKSVQ